MGSRSMGLNPVSDFLFCIGDWDLSFMRSCVCYRYGEDRYGGGDAKVQKSI